MRYRARLGWASGAWSVTGLMDYQAHWYHTGTAPPNVNGNFCLANGTTGGGTLPCAISNYSNLQTPLYTFDVSLGYDTGDRPANDHLKNISVQFIVSNVTAKHPGLQYHIASGGANPAAFDILKPNNGRMYSIILTKTW